MAELRRNSMAVMIAAARVPVTVKCRIGIDDQEEEHGLDQFVKTVANAGCRTFIVHARKAWLEGLSPKIIIFWILLGLFSDGRPIRHLGFSERSIGGRRLQRGARRSRPCFRASGPMKCGAADPFGQPGGRLWRRQLSETAQFSGSGVELLQRALETVAMQRAKLAAAA